MKKIKTFEWILMGIGVATLISSVIFCIEAFDKDNLEQLKVDEESEI